MPLALAQMYEQMDVITQKELYDYAVFLISRKKETVEAKQLAKIGSKPIDSLYADLISEEREAVTASARQTIWEQIKNDTW